MRSVSLVFSKILTVAFLVFTVSVFSLTNDAYSQSVFGNNSSSDVHVRGHTRSNGTYVRPHYRSAPNSTTNDNWSTIGNVNPYTGQRGTQRRRGLFGR